MPLPTETTDLPADGPTASADAPGRRQPKIWAVGAWVAVAIWAATIFWLSSRTGPQIEEMNIFELSDKVAHFIAFFAGAPALVCALRWSTKLPWKRIASLAAVLLAFYGATDEAHQLTTVNRTGADVFDWMGDALGGLTGAVLTTLIYARIERSHGTRRPAPEGDRGT